MWILPALLKGFSEIASPLYALTEKNRLFVWTDECQRAFDCLKEHLTTTPVLAMPDDNAGFILDVDASNCAIGGVLSQLQDGVERVVAYASRKLSRTEQNYCY